MEDSNAETIIDLLVEISNKLTLISKQISSKNEPSNVIDKLDEVVTKLGYIDTNTSN